MNAKIKWYQEVLDLEPSSKVFFPLARLFADNGQPDEALATLRQGLEKNPDHFEAKLLLIELQLAQGGGRAVQNEVGALADKMAGYPAFWQAWADMLAARDDARDPAFALQFLAAYFKGNRIAWADVIEQGLRVVLDAGFAARADLADVEPLDAVAPGADASLDDDLADVEPLDVALDDDANVEDDEEDAAPVQDEDFDFSDAVAEVDELLADLPDDEEYDLGGEDGAADADGTAEEDGEDEDASEESFSVRTKTMAVLLEDQGDYKGALSIYEELAAGAEGAKREDLVQRIEALRDKMQGKGDASSETGEVQSHDLSDALKGKTKLMSTLEALAGRLEARAAG